MDIYASIKKIQPTCKLKIINNDYNSIVWNSENTLSKPTLAECEAAWQEIINEAPIKLLRAERNNKLFETDIYAIPDFGHPSEEVKQAWITYRQALRDLPTTATPQLDENGELTNITWPTPPS